jgi:lipopolysaccharide export LptBFGC system permease protein LptF
MKILDRYFIHQFIMCLFWCLLIFVFFYVMIDFFGRLDEIIEGKGKS